MPPGRAKRLLWERSLPIDSPRTRSRRTRAKYWGAVLCANSRPYSPLYRSPATTGSLNPITAPATPETRKVRGSEARDVL
jgi:hypothetical protein